jgi:hypothetical protein
MGGFAAGTTGYEREGDGDGADVTPGGNRDLFGINNAFDTAAGH